MAVRITCINKDAGNHENPYVAIQRFGWTNEQTGKSGRSTRDEMYDWVVNKKGEAYVTAGGARARLIGQVSPRGTRFLKTVADGTDRDNLLKLPECP
jgi:hypothetical protein